MNLNQTTKKSISVVIPTFNGIQLLRQNLPSVFDALNVSKSEYEVIIVDDASSDDTEAILFKEFPMVEVLKNEINMGFSCTINKGIKKAKMNLVFLLNNDVKLFEDYFIHQFKYFNDNNTFGVMGTIIGYDNDNIQDVAKYPAIGLINISGTKKIQVNATTKWIPTFFLSGANALVDRNKLLTLDGFNEIFSPFYGEDTEMGIRARRLGWSLWYEPISICRHPNSATIDKYTKKIAKKIIIGRNKIIMHSLHLPYYVLPLYFAKLLLKSFIMPITGRTYFIKSIYQAFMLRSMIINERKKFDELSNSYPNSMNIYEVKKQMLKVISSLEIISAKK
jgi:GT2 family glycosyltransferase